MDVKVYEQIPEGFLEAFPRDLQRLLGGPSIITLPGRDPRPLFVSTLLHGNEHSSIIAVQALLKRYRKAGKELPRAMIILVGNVAATKVNVRRKAGQKDYNRVWDGAGDSPEHKMAAWVKDFVAQRKPFACVDIHNNTGVNPCYGCVSHLDRETLTMAAFFSRTTVYFTKPSSALTIVMGNDVCPSITVECGMSGEFHGVERAIEFIDAMLHIRELSEHNTDHDSFDLYHTKARMLLPKNALFGFGGFNPQVDFRFPDHFEHMNFVEQPQDSLLGWRFNEELRLAVEDNEGNDVAAEYLRYEEQEIRTKQTLVPAMFTKNKQVAVIDCLGYFMEHYTLPSPLPSREERLKQLKEAEHV